MTDSGPSRFTRALLALSQLGNVLFFNGSPAATISGDAHKFGRTYLKWLIDTLYAYVEDDHCQKANLHDVARAEQLVVEHESYRGI